MRGDLSRHLDMTVQLTAPEDSFPDDRLRLIYMCCHPALAADARAAMALREVCSLTTEQIAAAFLRARRRSRSGSFGRRPGYGDLALPYVVPSGAELDERTEDVLRAIFLIFTKGYANPKDMASPRRFAARPSGWRG